MTTSFIEFDEAVDQKQDRFINELQAFCAQPCITGQGIGVRETAELTALALRRLGAAPRIIETDGAPVVYGEIGDGPRTLLIYDHYDVRLVPDFTGGKLVVQDAYIDVRYSNVFRLRFGKAKVPFGL